MMYLIDVMVVRFRDFREFSCEDELQIHSALIPSKVLNKTFQKTKGI